MNSKINDQISELSMLWHKLYNTYNFRESLERYPYINSLNDTELCIIRVVSESDDIIIRDILNETRVPKSTLTSTIDRLEKRKLIKRCISTKDKRSYNIKLTSEGREVQRQHIAYEKELYGGIINALDSDEERELLLSLCRKMVDNLLKSSSK